MRVRVRVSGKVRDRVAVRVGLRGKVSLPCVERSFSSAAAAVPRCASASSACAFHRSSCERAATWTGLGLGLGLGLELGLGLGLG